ncbi:aromatic ring-hydroxylating dioxygenase subunit alpha [Caldilinea sp.]|jgi:phenylpropionate dioxygenase-like ring-hydroxylating dioxygenase large terminal subunit|uniref:aromatic ring-hydroxylating dioxygenase subunit alpha n=1 Tax=Caldilinea sp. TaxID=2293560 RepID=UPI0021DF3AA2|nr:aromatic ring-hydroxylating dioxygenase subunit alpha [Caldilinea sp.]GIV67257.1 MAG: chlorophyll a oxygenase [Caldilinea sp.]
MIDDAVLLNDWHPVATMESLRERQILGVRLLEEDIVLWRIDDQVLAWQDLCIHRGTRLSLGKVEDGALVCPYHGWSYDVSGRCVHIPAHPDQIPPAKARVKPYHAQVRYGLIWVCLGEPSGDVPPFPEWEDPAFRKILCGPYAVRASGPRIVENFLDIAHFPFVHEGILGDKAHPEISDYRAEITSEGVVAQGVRVYQPDPYGTGKGDTVSYTYKALRPLTAYLLKEADGPRFSILLTITPHAATESTAWMWMTMNYGHDIPEEKLRSWQDTIFSQDRPILESQRPELLPLDLQAELHLRSDRLAIAYRTWLNQLGLSFGTA